MDKARMFVRGLGLAIARRLGTEITDADTGRPLGRALVIGWRGKVLVIGLDTPVRPAFLPQKRLTYWKQELGFTVHPRPDFPNERTQRDAAARPRA